VRNRTLPWQRRSNNNHYFLHREYKRLRNLASQEQLDDNGNVILWVSGDEGLRRACNTERQPS